MWGRTGVALALLLGSLPGPAVHAAPPVFTNPLSITNPYHPFEPGGVKVYRGRDSGASTVLVDLYLSDTRTFQVNGADVPTHVLQETEFADGDVSEISRNFFAQADDGTVFYFGELVDTYENGAVTGHEGSWIVGGATQPGDPPDAGNASAPAVFMPAAPGVDDMYRPEDLFPLVDETDTVKRVGLQVRVPAGRFGSAIQVLETSRLPDSTDETKWYAAGVGVIKGKAHGETFALVASTIRPR